MLYFCFGFGVVDLVGCFDEFIWFQVFVVYKEMFDCIQFESWNVFDVLDVVLLGVIGWDVQYFVVVVVFVDYLEYFYWLCCYQYFGEDWLWQQYQCVQWVVIVIQGVFDEVVVGWVGYWGVQVLVQMNLFCFMVDFVFVVLVFGNFDGYVELYVLVFLDQSVWDNGQV